MKESKINGLKLDLTYPSHQLIYEICLMLDGIFKYLNKEILARRHPFILGFTKFKLKNEEDQRNLKKEIISAKQTLINLHLSCEVGQLPEAERFKKIQTLQPMLFALLGKRLGRTIEKIPESKTRLIRISKIKNFEPAKNLEPVKKIEDKPIPELKTPPPPIMIIIDKNELGSTIKPLPASYGKLVKRITDMAQTKNKTESLYWQLPFQIDALKSFDERLTNFIISLNKKDILGLLIILLAQPEQKNLKNIIEMKVTPGFWEKVLAGKQINMGYPSSKYEISKTKTLGHIGFELGGFLGPKIKQPISLLPHQVVDLKWKNLPSRTAMEVVFGTFCYIYAKSFETAIEHLKKAKELFAHEDLGIFNINLLIKIAIELNTASLFEFNKELQLSHGAYRGYYEDYHLKQNDPIKIKNSCAYLNYSLKNLEKKVDRTITEYTEYQLLYVKLGLTWGDFRCADMLHKVLLNKKSTLQNEQAILLYKQQLVIVAAPVKEKHWVAGHLLYLQMLKELIELFLAQENVNKSFIYECCVHAIKTLYVSCRLYKHSTNFIHNSFSEFKPEKISQELFSFFKEQAQKINPIENIKIMDNEIDKTENSLSCFI